MKTFISFLQEKNMYAPLKHNDLTKRGGFRVQAFLDKIKDGETFLTTKGLVKIDKSQYSDIEAQMPQNGYSAELKAKNDKNSAIKVSYPKDFFKTPEFGGKGVGFGTAAEDAFLSKFRKELEETLKKENQPAIKMRVGGRLVMVSGIESTPGTPKSDFHLLGPKGEEVAWLSHKAGSKPTDFQQYGGLSASVFKSNKEVKAFMKATIAKFPKGLDRAQAVYRPVLDNTVIQQSVWGVDWKIGGKRGRDNVDEFHQGLMKLVKKNNVYAINSHHQGKNSDKLDGNGYEAIYYARFTTDRGANVAGEFLPRARVGVFPRAKAGNTAEKI